MNEGDVLEALREANGLGPKATLDARALGRLEGVAAVAVVLGAAGEHGAAGWLMSTEGKRFVGDILKKYDETKK